MKHSPVVNHLGNSFPQILTNLSWENFQDPAVDMAPVTDAMDEVHSPQTLPPDPDFDDLLFQNSIGDTSNALDEVNTESVLTVTANVSLNAESASHDLNNSLSSVQALGEDLVEEDFLDLDSNSILSIPDTATVSSTDDKDNECSRRLYLWSTKFPISRVQKTTFWPYYEMLRFQICRWTGGHLKSDKRQIFF